MEGILVPVCFFGMIAAIVLVPQVLRARERERLHDTVRLAYDKGQPVPPELVEALQPGSARPPLLYADRKERDLRAGIIWLAIGLGVLAIGGVGYASLYSVGGAVEFLATFASLAAIPIFVGLAFLLLYALGRKSAA